MKRREHINGIIGFLMNDPSFITDWNLRGSLLGTTHDLRGPSLFLGISDLVREMVSRQCQRVGTVTSRPAAVNLVSHTQQNRALCREYSETMR